MKTIYCVTGATGHLGNNVVKMLVDSGKSVRALVLEGQPTDMLDKNVQIVYGNTCDKQSLVPLFEHKQDERLVVIHMAAIVSITEKYDKRVYDVNVKGTRNMVELAEQNNVDKFVYVSSVHAIATEKNVLIADCTVFDESRVEGNYAKSKAIATRYVLDEARQGKLNATILLPSGIIGVRDYCHNHLMNMIEKYIEGKLPMAVKGSYDFVDVTDVAQAVLSAVTKGRTGECYLITNRNYTIKEILDMAAKSLNIKRIKHFVPLSLARAVAPLCEAHYRRKKMTPLFTKYSLYVLDSGDVFCHDKATKELDYHPKDMQQTIDDTVQWFVHERGVVVGKNMLPRAARQSLRRKRAKLSN